MTAALETDGLVAGYERGLPIVKGASVRLGDREIVTILGPNGAGKSTLIKAIAGLVPITDGTVSLFGEVNRKDFFIFGFSRRKKKR